MLDNYFVMTKSRSHCPIIYALDTFGDKWTLMILRDIFFSDKKYYQEFLSSEEGIATNILANRLSVLEENGVISKHQDINNKRKFIYQPTSKGIDLIPVMLEIIAWAVKYDKDTLLPKSKVDYILKHKDKVISETKNKFLTTGLGEEPAC